MAFILGLIVFFLIIGGLAYHRVNATIWSGVVLVTLAVFAFFHIFPWYLLVPITLMTLVIVAIFHLPELRKSLFMYKTFKSVKKTLPPMSQTEKEALDAGDVWWEGDLFQGSPDWKKLKQMPTPKLSVEEQQFMDKQVNTLCEQLDDWKIMHEDHDLPASVWEYIKKEKFLSLCLDKKFGGLGFSAYAHSSIVTKVASRSLSAAVTIMVPNSLGPAELLVHYGTKEQQDHYLPKLARGEEIPCFGLTAPTAGSDAASIPDTGIICKGMHEGSEVLGIRLNFDKRYITLAPVATVMGLAFKLFDPDKLYGDKIDLGITLSLLPTNYPGVETGKRHNPMGVAFMNGPIRGKDVFIPLDWVIGGKAMIGQGWRMLMECLSMGRGISLPALATAVCQVSYRTTGAYAKIRKQFKTSIANFEGVQESLSRIAGYTYMLEACRAMTVNAVDMGIKPSLASAIAKYNMTEISRHVLNDAMDIHAGKAIQMGPNNCWR